MTKADTPDMRPCPCCGQSRAFPTRPGKWRYKYVGVPYWHNCSVRVSTGEEDRHIPEGNLMFYREPSPHYPEDVRDDCKNPDGSVGPCEWPEDCLWEKVSDESGNPAEPGAVAGDTVEELKAKLATAMAEVATLKGTVAWLNEKLDKHWEEEEARQQRDEDACPWGKDTHP